MALSEKELNVIIASVVSALKGDTTTTAKIEKPAVKVQGMASIEKGHLVINVEESALKPGTSSKGTSYLHHNVCYDVVLNGQACKCAVSIWLPKEKK